MGEVLREERQKYKNKHLKNKNLYEILASKQQGLDIDKVERLNQDMHMNKAKIQSR